MLDTTTLVVLAAILPGLAPAFAYGTFAGWHATNGSRVRGALVTCSAPILTAVAGVSLYRLAPLGLPPVAGVAVWSVVAAAVASALIWAASRASAY